MGAAHNNDGSKGMHDNVEIQDQKVNLANLRAVVPAHCFEASLILSLYYIVRDILLAAALFYVATFIPSIPSDTLRTLCWTAYGFTQGLIFTGIWILAHECGHEALFKTKLTNNSLGLVLHSFLLVPFFSWKYSHAKHHRYTNHMERDTAFVPRTAKDADVIARLKVLLHVGEDAPVVNLLALVLHQLLGWPLYLLFHVTSGRDSGGRRADGGWKSWLQNHLNPFAEMFCRSQKPFVLLSDLGLLSMALLIRQVMLSRGMTFALLVYGVPYLWVNHWLVAITYLHHNHHSASHYGNGAWSFSKGALATVDRDFGFIGRHFFHGIIEYHVVHHLFAKVPFYRAEEATDAIRSQLGSSYIKDGSPFMISLWTAFTTMSHVRQRAQGSQVWVWA